MWASCTGGLDRANLILWTSCNFEQETRMIQLQRPRVQGKTYFHINTGNIVLFIDFFWGGDCRTHIPAGINWKSRPHVFIWWCVTGKKHSHSDFCCFCSLHSCSCQCFKKERKLNRHKKSFFSLLLSYQSCYFNQIAALISVVPTATPLFWVCFFVHGPVEAG